MMLSLLMMMMKMIHGHYYCGARDPSLLLMMLKLEMKRRVRHQADHGHQNRMQTQHAGPGAGVPAVCT